VRLRAEERSIFTAKNRRKAVFAFPSTAGSRSLGFWNSILQYVTKAKDLKAAEAETRQIEARAKRTSLSKSGH
jgi:hypothetical protein